MFENETRELKLTSTAENQYCLFALITSKHEVFNIALFFLGIPKLQHASMATCFYLISFHNIIYDLSVSRIRLSRVYFFDRFSSELAISQSCQSSAIQSCLHFTALLVGIGG